MKIADPKGHRRLIKKGNAAVLLCLWAIVVLAGGIALAASEEGHGPGEAQGAHGWLDTDWFRVLNFAVLAVALFFVLRKPMTAALGSRIEGIKEQLANLEAEKEAAEKKLAEYNEKLSQLEKEAEKIVDEYIQQGKEANARIRREAEAAAEKLQLQARRNIEYEFARAKHQLQEEILEKSLEKAAEIIKKKITAADQDRLVDEYLTKVVTE